MSRLVSIKSTQGRLILQSPEISDASNLLERLGMPSCVELIPHLRNREFTVESLSQQIETWRSISMVSGLFLVVERISDGRVIGDGGFEFVDFENQTGEIDISLNDESDVRGKGYAVEALETMLDYAFKELGMKSVKL
jgi:RimJ/RimL family protein N-acetyltransferase